MTGKLMSRLWHFWQLEQHSIYVELSKLSGHHYLSMLFLIGYTEASPQRTEASISPMYKLVFARLSWTIYHYRSQSLPLRENGYHCLSGLYQRSCEKLAQAA
jgi:hypothetical protein